MHKVIFLFSCGFLLIFSTINAVFLNPEEFNRSRSTQTSPTSKELIEKQRIDRAKNFKSGKEFRAEYYRAIRMPKINQDPDYLLQDHPIEEDQLQEAPVR